MLLRCFKYLLNQILQISLAEIYTNFNLKSSLNHSKPLKNP